MTTFKPRTLVGNSLGSLVATALVMLSTLLIPAIMARGFARVEFDLYLAALAFLPAMLILPQSIRTVGASQLALAFASHGRRAATREFVRFNAYAALVHLCLSVAGVEAYGALARSFGGLSFEIHVYLYFLIAYSLGVMLVGLIAAPAAAAKDFRLDNIAKFWPGLFQVAALTLIWSLRPSQGLTWAFTAYAASSWTIAIFFLWRFGAFLEWPRTAAAPDSSGLRMFFLKGLSGVLWWNVTAFLATSASIMIVAIMYPRELAPFSTASTLLGLISAGLIAISGPITLHAAAMDEGDTRSRRRFFLQINSLFQAYIGAATLVILLMPEAIYQLWLNAELAPEVKRYSIMLLPAAVLRILTMAFTLFVMSRGRQHTLWLSPLVEAILSTGGSLVLGYSMGAGGIPLALALAAAVRLMMTVFHDSRNNAPALALEPNDLLLSAWRLAKSRR